MREKDIKILWGRSGNRCAICKIELTPDGDIITLGEMAHIVARNASGPRGESDLSSSERDNYSNLVLLCPTHHTQIDKIPDEWPVQKLHDIRNSHEKWVSEQLDHGNISIRPIDNLLFLNKRIESYTDFSEGNIWVASSITPLNISGDTINPLSEEFINAINSTKLPQEISFNSAVNAYHTRPNENGLINDDLRHLSEGNAHRIQIFRNGHCEFLICLQGSVNQVTAAASKDDIEITKGLQVVRYTDLAECLSIQIDTLLRIWNDVLFFNDMSLNAYILNNKNTILYSQHGTWDVIFGSKVESEILETNCIVSKNTSPADTTEKIIKTFVNYFGLVLEQIKDKNGEFIKPSKLIKNI